MKLSEDRISHLAHIVIDGIYNDDLVDFSDDDKALKEAKIIITKILTVDDDADTKAREMIRSQKKHHIIEGSREWDILYNKYFEEELTKRGF